jgi:hypothetical protein
MSSIVDHLTELYVLIDDFFLTHPALAHWRRSPHGTPRFADSEVLTIALLQGCLGVASLKQTYRLVAHNCRAAFPHLCSYQQWIARLQALAIPIGVLLETTAQVAIGSAACYLIEPSPGRSVTPCAMGGYACCAKRERIGEKPARAGFSALSSTGCAILLDASSMSR